MTPEQIEKALTAASKLKALRLALDEFEKETKKKDASKTCKIGIDPTTSYSTFASSSAQYVAPNTDHLAVIEVDNGVILWLLKNSVSLAEAEAIKAGVTI